MRLNHLDLAVPDVAATADFFVRGCGFTPRFTRGANEMAVLQAEDGFVLVLTVTVDPHYPDGFHIGFLQPSDDAVHAAHASLRDAGFDAPLPAVAYGCLQFWVRAPGGIVVEISHRG